MEGFWCFFSMDTAFRIASPRRARLEFSAALSNDSNDATSPSGGWKFDAFSLNTFNFENLQTSF